MGGRGWCLSRWQLRAWGGFHEVAVKEVRKLGSALARQTGQEEGEAISHLFQKLSVLLIKGNAALVKNREPGQVHPRVDGVQ